MLRYTYTDNGLFRLNKFIVPKTLRPGTKRVLSSQSVGQGSKSGMHVRGNSSILPGK